MACIIAIITPSIHSPGPGDVPGPHLPGPVGSSDPLAHMRRPAPVGDISESEIYYESAGGLVAGRVLVRECGRRRAGNGDWCVAAWLKF